jgi:membrane associated rhomboid family serine protease
LRSFEIIAGLLVAAVLFILLKLIGMVIKFALIAAVLGFVAGLLLARSLRR